MLLDELPEFNRQVIDSLEEVVSKGEVVLRCGTAKVIVPAKFRLIATMYVCPCGGSTAHRQCKCTEEMIIRYQSRVPRWLLRDSVIMHEEEYVAELAAEKEVRND
jgi:predicted ATPase with chaperone activity